MRFKHIYDQAIDEIRAKSRKIIIFITAEKPDTLTSLTNLLQFKKQIKIELPERADRRRILDSLVPKHVSESVDMLEMAKYLQGKTFRDIKQTMMKFKRKLPQYFMRKSQNINIDVNEEPLTQTKLVEALIRLEKDRKLFGEKSVRIPEVKWDDVGGLASAKEDIT